MSLTDLDAVAARRVAIARELVELKVAHDGFEAEDRDLALTERVLRRLAGRLRVPPLVVLPSDYDTDSSKREGAIDAFWTSLAERIGAQYQFLFSRLRDASRRMFS